MGYSPKLSLLCCLSCFQLDHWYTTSPRSSIFFYWTMMLRNQDLGVNCSLCHWVSLLTGFLVGRVRKCMCVHKPMHNRTAIFISLSLSLYLKKKSINTDISASKIPSQIESESVQFKTERPYKKSQENFLLFNKLYELFLN